MYLRFDAIAFMDFPLCLLYKSNLTKLAYVISENKISLSKNRINAFRESCIVLAVLYLPMDRRSSIIFSANSVNVILAFDLFLPRTLMIWANSVADKSYNRPVSVNS